MFPVLESQNYLLHGFLPSDLAFVFEALSHPDVIEYYGVSYNSFESAAAQMQFYETIWNERTGCWWKIVEKGTGQPVGACGMNYYSAEHEKAEMGYWLLPHHWKKGIMPEVLPIMIKHLFANWKLHRLEAVIEDGNETSCSLAEKLGFFYEGTLRDVEMKKGKRISLKMYSLLKPDFTISW